MTYKLFLDDERLPSEVDKGYNDSDFLIARDGREFHKIIEERGCPDFISWDYYLANNINSVYILYDFLFMIQDGDFVLPEKFDYAIHSRSLEGARELESIFNEFEHLFK